MRPRVRYPNIVKYLIFLRYWLDIMVSRSHAIAASVLAHEALTLVAAHHQGGLAPFAVDAYIEQGELELVMTCSVRAVRVAFALAYPWKGCVPDPELVQRYRALYAVHLENWPLANAANRRLSAYTRQMNAEEKASLEYAASQLPLDSQHPLYWS